MLEDWNSLLWHEIPFVALDTETTGLGPDDRIVQIAFASFYDEGLRVKKWLVYPGRPIPEVVTRIHGITDDMVRDAPTFRDILDEVLSELNRAPWVAHNLPFDAKMLAKEIPRDKWPRGMPTLCTLSYARTRHPETSRRRGHKLADLANVFEHDYKTASLHDAGYDAEVLAHVTHRMMHGLSVGEHMTKFSEDWISG